MTCSNSFHRLGCLAFLVMSCGALGQAPDEPVLTTEEQHGLAGLGPVGLPKANRVVEDRGHGGG